MARYDVAIVGTGDPDGDGFAMAYRHASGYEALAETELVACCDLVEERARSFAAATDVDRDAVYTDAETMVSSIDPDVVSVCVPPAAHRPVVETIVAAGPPLAIHCEKPMAETWGGARSMAATCEAAGVQLTFNHQRRFGGPFRRARAIVADGEIGEPTRVEFAASNLYDYGTHSVDLSNFLLGEARPAWVLAGLDYREENRWFGTHNENQAVAVWGYENGVSGLATTGDEGQAVVGAHNVVVGTEGAVEVGVHDGPTLRVRRDGATETIDTGEEGLHGPGYVERAIDEVVAALDAGRASELCAENALAATELIFGAYESVRRRGRVRFPLEIEDNPLVEMVETGTLALAPAEE